MKKLLIIAAFAFAVSLAASFGAGQVKLTIWPTDDRRDQQWTQSSHSQERGQMQRARWQREQFQREQWQRERWQRDEQVRRERHQQPRNYNFWFTIHRTDWENRGSR
jgi:hypothetical protein